MFELRAAGNLSDDQIVKQINILGYESRRYNFRDRKNGAGAIVQKGGAKLNVKQFWVYIHNPIYAGVICEKWTDISRLRPNLTD
jgi:hypothetical protein